MNGIIIRSNTDMINIKWHQIDAWKWYGMDCIRPFSFKVFFFKHQVVQCLRGQQLESKMMVIMNLKKEILNVINIKNVDGLHHVLMLKMIEIS